MIWGCHYFWKHPDTSPHGSPQISFNPSIGPWFASSAAGFWHMACAVECGTDQQRTPPNGFVSCGKIESNSKVPWFSWENMLVSWRVPANYLNLEKARHEKKQPPMIGKSFFRNRVPDATGGVASTPGCIYPTFLSMLQIIWNIKCTSTIWLSHKWESFCVTFLMILCNRAEDCFQTSWNQTWHKSSVPHCLRSERNTWTATTKTAAIKPATLTTAGWRVETSAGLSRFLVFGLLASFWNLWLKRVGRVGRSPFLDLKRSPPLRRDPHNCWCPDRSQLEALNLKKEF